MKKNIIILLMTTIFSGFTDKKDTGELRVEIIEIKKKEGNIVFMLFDKAEGFPREVSNVYKKGIVTQYSDKASFTFKDIPFGKYAVAVFQDEDKNGEINTNFIGMPKESVGASNMTKMGKPNFEKCSFEIKEVQKKITIKFIL